MTLFLLLLAAGGCGAVVGWVGHIVKVATDPADTHLTAPADEGRYP